MPAVLIGGSCDGLLIDEVPEADGANLLEAVFEAVEVSDRWGVYSDTTEVNPC